MSPQPLGRQQRCAEPQQETHYICEPNRVVVTRVECCSHPESPSYWPIRYLQTQNYTYNTDLHFKPCPRAVLELAVCQCTFARSFLDPGLLASRLPQRLCIYPVFAATDSFAIVACSDPASE